MTYKLMFIKEEFIDFMFDYVPTLENHSVSIWVIYMPLITFVNGTAQ